MKHYAKPSTQFMQAPAAQEPADTGTSFDVQDLLDKGGEILRREIRNLMSESAGGKLQPGSARDLVAYLKLLSELKAAQTKELENLTDEELAALTKQKP